MSTQERPTGSWSVDLLVAFLGTVVAACVVLIDPGYTTIRTGFSLPIVLVLPGYALVSLLFPRWDSRGTETYVVQRSLGLLERVLLGVLASAAIVPGVAYALNFTHYGITTRPLLVGVAGITIFLLLLAFVRRLAVPSAERFRVPLGGFEITGYFRPVGRDLRSHRPHAVGTGPQYALNVLFVVSVVLLLFTGVWAVATPMTGEPYTEMTLLAEDDNGDLIADGYPAAGEGSVTVAIDNREGEPREYTVIVVVQNIVDGEGGVTVEEQQEIDRRELSVLEDERETLEYEVAGEDVAGASHVVFLLYVEDPPTSPTTDNAYRSVALNVDES